MIGFRTGVLGAAVLAALNFVWLDSYETKNERTSTFSGRSSNYQHTAVYADEEGASGVSFTSRMGIGTIDNTPGLNPFRMQSWSEPISDCSNEEFRCVSAGNFTIFVPVANIRAGRIYRYRSRILRVLDCSSNHTVCTLEIVGDPQRQEAGRGQQNSPLNVYFLTNHRGIISIGFSDVDGDGNITGRQFKLKGEVGLFGSL